MRVFLDANVLFSASNENSHIGELLALLAGRGWAVTSDVAIEEVHRNLSRKRPEWMSAFGRLRSRLDIVPTVRLDLPIALNDKDLPLLCAAIHGGCDYFVTGDKQDFGHLYGQRIEGVEIMSLKMLAKLFTKSS